MLLLLALETPILQPCFKQVRPVVGNKLFRIARVLRTEGSAVSIVSSIDSDALPVLTDALRALPLAGRGGG